MRFFDKENCVVLSVWLPSKYLWETYEINNIKDNIFTAAEILIVVFWVMTLYSLLQGYQHFSGTCIFRVTEAITQRMEAAGSYVSRLLFQIGTSIFRI
jgi:hypothetical protein